MSIPSYRILVFSFVYFIWSAAPAQVGEADSLAQLLSKKMPDTARVKLLNDLTKSLFNNNLNSAIIIAMQSKDLAEKVKYKTGLALALKQMGICYYLKGKYVDAIKTWQQALDVYSQMGDKTGVANMLSNQGAVYFNQGDDAKSLELHLQSLKLSEEIDDTLRIVTSLTNIGGIYLNKRATYRKALDYFLRSYQ